MTKKNEVTTKEETAVSVNAQSSGTFSESVDASDIIIPKVLLMQAISQLVEQDKAKQGDFVHSLDEVVVGAKEDKPVEFIVLGMFKTLQTYEDNKYVKTESLTPENAGLPYEEVVNGVTVNRTKTMNYYVIRPADVENMSVFPMVITFKRTSLKGGKKLATKLMMLEEFGAEIYMKTFKLVAKQEEGDKGKYYVMDIVDGRKSNDVEVKQAIKWSERLKTTAVQVHEAENEQTANTIANPAEGAAGSTIMDF
jgi:hypothetical protein